MDIKNETKTIANCSESTSSTTTIEQVEQFKRDFEKKLASEQMDVSPEFEETFRKHWRDILA